jgi:D-alanyl-D-alanine carboxypeptidase
VTERAPSIDRIADLIRRQDIPGASIAVSVDVDITAFAVGTPDLAGDSRLTPNDRFPIYSITKTFIAAAILRLIAAGDLALDMPVRAVLPGIPPAIGPDITLRRLLNHTAGLPDYGGLPAYHDDLRRDLATPWSDERFLAVIDERGMAFPPGAGWAYSNIGYLLLRRVLETTGMTFAQALDRLVIAPAGLRETTVLATLDDMRAITPGYSTQLGSDAASDTPEDVRPRYHPGWVSHGLVASTAADTARFLDALLAGDLVPQPLLGEMLTPIRVPGEHPPLVAPSYGLGVMLDPGWPAGTLVGHGGGGPGYATAAFRSPDAAGRAITVVIFVNIDRADAQGIAFDVLKQGT